MKVLITGDSHLGTLLQGQRRQLGPQSFLADVTIKPLGNGRIIPTPFFKDQGKFAEIIDPEYKQHFDRLPPVAEKYDFIGFSAPLHTVRVWRMNWCKHSPWSMGGNDNLVSDKLLLRIIEDDVKYALKLLDIIGRTTRTFVIEPPWPFHHHYAVLMNGEEKVKYIHNSYRNYVINELSRKSIPVIEIDSSWVDAKGFMNPRFRRVDKKDQHHGNAEFGRLMMEKIYRFLKKC
ncbi:hypothetical protein [Nitrosomonas sp. Is37]|uniref:hypothetical protein n=1 Tax=Nitrosomonas sp. Is37 TaxID=3080535 RepID=UPI00294B4847|nr:hypothetical protein [Nitrosomonas sp. Is37]MDV6344915.1 hypothetical protein [Nitrosomonas sp. Is37]